MNYLVTFHSVSDALMAKKRLDSNGERGAVVPTPRALSSSCGYALEVESTSNLALKELLGDFDGDIGEIYIAKRSGKHVTYTPIESSVSI